MLEKNTKWTVALWLLLVWSCAQSPQSADTNTGAAPTEASPAPAPEPLVVDSLLLQVENSHITWRRHLDQKSSQKTMKLLGQQVQVDLGPVQMTMDGTVAANQGRLVLSNGEPTSGNLRFDMHTFHFAEDAGQGLFNVKDYPESELRIDTFKVLEGDSFHNYIASLTLDLQDASRSYEVPLMVHSTADRGKLTGSFSINTLDFPLRPQAKAQEINRDEITVDLELVFGN